MGWDFAGMPGGGAYLREDVEGVTTFVVAFNILTKDFVPLLFAFLRTEGKSPTGKGTGADPGIVLLTA